jgi:hypothetical protein
MPTVCLAIVEMTLNLTSRHLAHPCSPVLSDPERAFYPQPSPSVLVFSPVLDAAAIRHEVLGLARCHLYMHPEVLKDQTARQ